MALQYPSFVVPQPTSTTLLDVLDQWQKGEAGGRAARDEREAKQALGQFVDSLYSDTNNVGVGARAGAAMNSGQGEIRSNGAGRSDPLASMLGLVNGSHDAAALAEDPRLRTALNARYPGGAPDSPTRVASVGDDDMNAYMDAARLSESGGNNQAANANSSALGPYQFLNDTWTGLMQQHPDLGLTPDGRTDPAQSEVAMRAFTGDNAKALRSAGIAINPTSLYASHFLGAGGAAQVLQAPTDTPMSALVSPAVLQANPQLADMTQADFVQWASAKGGNGQNGYQAPRAGADGVFAGPMRQVPLPPREVLMSLMQNPATREFGASLMQQVRASQLADQFQTFRGGDGSLMQMNVATGETKVLQDGRKTESFRTITDPNERAQYGIPADDKGVYQIDQTGKLSRAGGGGVNVSIGGEKAYDQKLNGNLADTFIATQDSSTNALKTLTTLDAMTAALDDPKFYSGFAAEPALGVKRLVASLGLDPSAATSMETFSALSKQSALDLMGGSLGAGFSNADRSFVIEQTAGLQATKEGNQALIDMQRQLAQRQIDIGKLASQYARAHEGRLDSDWGSYLAEWAEANPLFPQSGGTARGSGGNRGGSTLPDPMGIR